MRKFIYIVLTIIALTISIIITKSVYGLTVFGLSIGGGLMWWCLSIAALFAILVITLILSIVYLWYTVLKKE